MGLRREFQSLLITHCGSHHAGVINHLLVSPSLDSCQTCQSDAGHRQHDPGFQRVKIVGGGLKFSSGTSVSSGSNFCSSNIGILPPSWLQQSQYDNLVDHMSIYISIGLFPKFDRPYNLCICRPHWSGHQIDPPLMLSKEKRVWRVRWIYSGSSNK